MSPCVTRLGGDGCSPHTQPQPLPMGIPVLQTETGPNPAPLPNRTLVPVLSGGEVPGTPFGQHHGDHHLPHQRGPSPTTLPPISPLASPLGDLDETSPPPPIRFGDPLPPIPRGNDPPQKLAAGKGLGATEAPRASGCIGVSPAWQTPNFPPIIVSTPKLGRGGGSPTGRAPQGGRAVPKP